MDELLEKIKTVGSFTKDDFFKLYRLLCKNTHPDLTGKDGRDFIRLQEIYDKLKDTLHAESADIAAYFNPYKVISELGYSRPLEARNCLFISLYRYVSLGLHTRKVRSKPVLKERNNMIIRTVLYWGQKYDREFVSIFLNFNTSRFDTIQMGNSLEREIKGKKYFSNGLRWFLHYQESGRTSAAQISREKLSCAITLLSKDGKSRSSIIPFAYWLLEELRTPPVIFGK